MQTICTYSRVCHSNSFDILWRCIFPLIWRLLPEHLFIIQILFLVPCCSRCRPVSPSPSLWPIKIRLYRYSSKLGINTSTYHLKSVKESENERERESERERKRECVCVLLKLYTFWPVLKWICECVYYIYYYVKHLCHNPFSSPSSFSPHSILPLILPQSALHPSLPLFTFIGSKMCQNFLLKVFPGRILSLFSENWNWTNDRTFWMLSEMVIT